MIYIVLIDDNGKENIGLCLKSKTFFVHRLDEHIKKYGGQFARILFYNEKTDEYEIGILNTNNKFNLTFNDLIMDWDLD